MRPRSTYPWFFFFRIVQLSLLLYFPVLVAILIIDNSVFLRILPLALLCQLIFVALFYRATRPLGTILSKVQKFRGDLPLDSSIRELYEKDEWAKIETALSNADNKLKDQINQTKVENEKIAAILESITDAIIAIDLFETLLFSNTIFRKSFVSANTSGIIPKLWHIFEKNEVLDTFRSVLGTGSSRSIKTLAHGSRYYDLNVTPLRGADGKVIGALGVFHDITEFKLTEQMRVDFVANVSHEIRTPLTSIKGYSQVLHANKSKFPEEFEGFLTKIVANTERMIALFNDLLNLSVIESKNILDTEEVLLKPIIGQIVPNIRTNYPDKKIEVKTEFGQETIEADPRLIETVITNLIDNACKYSGDEITITISTAESQGKTHLRVKDNGPGIPKEHLSRIFERFYRVDSSREAKRGTGLGLSIVKHIIMKHGGRIWAESEGAGSGTTFVIELPSKQVLNLHTVD
jgi:two-component system phosphate regulon sensor histidine kinase PhoR